MRWPIALRGSTAAVGITFLLAYLVIFVSSGWSAPLAAFYVSVISVISVSVSLLACSVYYVLFETRSWFVVFVSIVLINTAVLSASLINIPQHDDSIEGSIITRYSQAGPGFVNTDASVVIGMLLLSIVSNGSFWIVALRNKR